VGHCSECYIELVGDPRHFPRGQHIFVEEFPHALRHGLRRQPERDQEKRDQGEIDVSRQQACKHQRQAAADCLERDRTGGTVISANDGDHRGHRDGDAHECRQHILEHKHRIGTTNAEHECGGSRAVNIARFPRFDFALGKLAVVDQAEPAEPVDAIAEYGDEHRDHEEIESGTGRSKNDRAGQDMDNHSSP